MGTRKQRMKNYSPEMRAEAVRLCEIDSRSQSQIAGSLGLSQATLNRWVREARKESAGAPSLDAGTEEKLRKLEAENHRLRQERDILKKAAAFFAKNQE